MSLWFSSSSSAEPTYWRDVRPILRKSCTVCHNQRQRNETDISGGLALDSYEAVLRWKEKNRPLVHPGQGAASLLYQVVVTGDGDKRMPLGGKPLPVGTIAVLKRWIDAGAKEGDKPSEVEVSAPNRAARRKLDVALPTTTTPEKSAFQEVPRGPLTLTLKVGPLSPVVALAFHPTEPWLAAGAYGRVTVWDVKAGKPVQVLTSVLATVNDVRFSPDGKLLAVAGGQPSAKGDLRLFATADWKLTRVLAGHDDVVASVSFRPDGAKLASASYDRTVRVWNVADGKGERVLAMHSDFVTCVAYSPDGKTLASGSKDRSVRLVEADTGASRFTFGDRDEDVLAVAFRPDGQAVVSAGLEPNLSWWSTSTGERLRAVGGHRGAVHDLAFSPDGKALASAGADGTLRLWNGIDGGSRRSLPAGTFTYSVAVSPDGKLVAAGGFDGLARLFDAATGQPRALFLSLPTGEWLTMTPAGYTDGSDSLMSHSRWTMSGRALPSVDVWRALRRPEAVAKALRGESLPAPTFAK